MPGCKINDRVVVIKTYLETAPKHDNVGSFHVVQRQCACELGYWKIKAAQDCAGYIGTAQTVFGVVGLTAKIPCGGEHCAPDACLQPIRPPALDQKQPAPPVELPVTV